MNNTVTMKKWFLSVLFLVNVMGLLLHAQKTPSKASLETTKKNLEAEIRYSNKLLNETKKNKAASMKELVILNNQITKREKLIGTISKEIKNVSSDISITETDIVGLEQDVKKLKKEYADIIRATAKTQSTYDRLTYVFAAEDFNQAYLRLRYFQQYSAYRKNQVRLIQEKQTLLQTKKATLETQKQSKTNLLKHEESEKKELASQQKQQNQTINQLKKKEKNLAADIKKKKANVEALNKKIQQIIQEEIRKANEEAAKRQQASSGTSGKPATTPSSKGIQLTPEEKTLSNNFAGNKGKLPWPTERGIISSSYGTHEHPVMKGIVTVNYGIDILTTKGAQARSVFDGVVVRVFGTPNGRQAVIVQHGEYRTVYSNLTTVSVRKDQKINTKQSIGTIYTDPDEDKTELQFQIWKGMEKVNPAQWIAN